MKAITVDGLSKSFTNSVKALNGISFSLDEGEVFGFLGPNGAGKTTTVKLLNGIMTPTEGSCRLFDIDPISSPHLAHGISGVLTEYAQMYGHLTGLQNLVFYANLFGIEGPAAQKRAMEMLERIGLLEAKDQNLASYSTGMRQRLSLARAMIHEPKILFLDEPTSGLDPESAKSVNSLLKELAQDRGTTVFLCTHQLRYAQDVCERYGLVDDGVLLADGDIDHLRSLVFSGVTVSIQTDRMPSAVDARRVDGETYEVKISDEDEIPLLVKQIVDDGGNIYSVTSRKPTLEEVYFALIEQRKSNTGGAKQAGGLND